MKSISIDIDGVIAKHYFPNSSFFFKIRGIGEKKLREKGRFGYLERVVNFMWHAPKKSFPESRKALETLKNNSYKVILNSSRPTYLHEITRKWAKRNGFIESIDTIHLRTYAKAPAESKLETIKAYQAKIHIDDDPTIIHKLLQTDQLEQLFLITTSKEIEKQFIDKPKVICKASLYEAAEEIIKRNDKNHQYV